MMSWARRKGTGRPVLTLLTLVLLTAVFGLICLYGRPPESARHRFHVPPSERVTQDLKTAGRGSTDAKDQLMTLDPTRKFLINSITTKPVFITGDDAWSLQVQLSDADIQFYLADRASRGFNAIWVGLADNTYSNHPPRDFYGNVPFNGPDFTHENPAYWTRVDRTLAWAAAQGITVFASPAFVGYGCTNGYCESYRGSSTEVLTAYGQFLGGRYRGYSNLVWVIGGDANPEDQDVQSKLDALANGIRFADPVHLMTAETYRGYSAQDIWSETSWLDLDALYLQPAEIPAKANAAYLSGTYPALMFEDWYEGDHSISELGVRQEGYWAVLSGCTLGRFFGNHAIWDFTWNQITRDPWKSQLGAAGSEGQAWLGRLFRSREHWKLVPDITHTVMIGGYDPRNFPSRARESLRSFIRREPFRMRSAFPVAARTSDGQTIIAYVPNGNATTITIDMSAITDSHSQAQCWWFNPRTGANRLIGALAASGSSYFTAPDSNDWVLVIDSRDASLEAPGRKDL
jgi:uncharacterized protein DUF4038/collagenase-like protein with putative collagen-binding domain